MDSTKPNITDNDPYKPAIFAAKYVLILNSLLFAAKAITGWLGDSFALMADAVNNLTDIGLSFGLYFGMKYASKPPDDLHAYGKAVTGEPVTLLRQDGVLNGKHALDTVTDRCAAGRRNLHCRSTAVRRGETAQTSQRDGPFPS